MRRSVLLLAIVALLTSFAALASADSPADKAPANVTNKHCPIMTANYVSPDIRSEYQGQYVYFCCDGCRDMFKADPAKYVAALPKEDQEAIKANAKCPVSNEDVDTSVRSEFQGKLVYFCCADCKAQFDKKNGIQ